MVFSQEKVQKYYPGAYMVPPMKVAKFPKGKEYMQEELLKDDNYIAEEKIDGNWYMVELTEKGDYCFSRTTSKKTGLLTEKGGCIPHIFLSLDYLPRNTVLVGEIFIPDKTSKGVREIMGCLPEKAVSRQKERGWVKYCVFDILYLDGQSLLNLTTEERIDILRENVEESEHIVFPQITRNNKKDFLRTMFSEGKEGIILKKKEGMYVPDKRPMWNWMAVKKEDLYDVVCIGFLPPNMEYTGKEIEKWEFWYDPDTGERWAGQNTKETPKERRSIAVTKSFFYNWIGSIKMGVHKDGKVVDIGSVSAGITDELAKDLRLNGENYLYKPMAVKAMEAYEDRLREPRLITFRDDINIEDCTWEKIF